MTKKANASRLLLISILLSIISITTTCLINIQIANEYLRSSGKTRALFGIKELLQFSYQYYTALPGIIAFILAFIAAVRANQKKKSIAAILLSLSAIIIVFLRIWRIFIL